VTAKKSSFPIVTLYRGNRWFLPYTLYQARKTNPDSEIILIGDDENKHLNCICRHYRCDKYDSAADRVRKVYRHKSIWRPEFEYVCIERWFILREFMLREGVDRCLYLDSDILVFSDLSRISRELPPSPMTWTGYSAHVNFITDVSALTEYCDFVVDVFANHERSIAEPDTLYGRIMRGEFDSNISDMVFFFDFNTKHPGRLFDVAVPRNDTVFDITIEQDQGMLMENGIKKIGWKDSRTPFATDAATLRPIQLHTIHFWKRELIPPHFRARDLRFFFVLAWSYVVLYAQKIARKVKKRSPVEQ